MEKTDNRQWQIFQFYNAYRLLVIALLIFINPVTMTINPNWPIPFYYFLSCYAFTILFFSYLTYIGRISFAFLVVLSLITDFIYLNALLFIGGTLSRGAGIFLNVALAAYCVQRPGILGIFFASLESLILLSHSATLYYIEGANTFFYSGLHGVSLFAVAVTALLLARRVKSSSAVAERKSKEVAFFQRLNEYIIERLKSGIILIDEQINIIMINKIAKKLFDNEHIMVNDALSVLSGPLSKSVEKWIHSDGKSQHPSQYRIKEQNLVVHILPDPSHKQGSALLIVEDQSKTVQKAQQLKLASLGQFTASISHELRNPLGSISHAVQLLKESEHLAPEDKRLSDIIHNNCDRMNLLIKNVLQISRGQKSKPTEFSAKRFFDQFRQKAFVKENVILNVDVRPCDLKIYFDKSQLFQLLIILIENSIKYGKRGSDNVTIHIKCFYDESQNRVVMSVADEGAGIDDEIKDKIYDPFYTTSRSGVGLGLFIAKELCDLNQAKLALIDTDIGAQFNISFRAIDEFQL